MLHARLCARYFRFGASGLGVGIGVAGIGFTSEMVESAPKTSEEGETESAEKPGIAEA